MRWSPVSAVRLNCWGRDAICSCDEQQPRATRACDRRRPRRQRSRMAARPGRRAPPVLHEMRAVRQTEAHKTDRLAELVCSNSFRSDDAVNNAVGLLHEEMRRCGSLILAAGDAHKLPAGGALAVDRD